VELEGQDENQEGDFEDADAQVGFFYYWFLGKVEEWENL
jgi:hypothetical protein